MKAIDILEACRAAPAEIRAIEQRRQEYLETAEAMGRAPDPTGVSGGGGSGDKTGSFATLAGRRPGKAEEGAAGADAGGNQGGAQAAGSPAQ